MDIVQARKLGIEVRAHPDGTKHDISKGIIVWQVRTPDGQWHELTGRMGQSVLDVWKYVLALLSSHEVNDE